MKLPWAHCFSNATLHKMGSCFGLDLPISPPGGGKSRSCFISQPSPRFLPLTHPGISSKSLAPLHAIQLGQMLELSERRGSSLHGSSGEQPPCSTPTALVTSQQQQLQLGGYESSDTLAGIHCMPPVSMTRSTHTELGLARPQGYRELHAAHGVQLHLHHTGQPPLPGSWLLHKQQLLVPPKHSSHGLEL